jgi:F-type H+-transporting ATPase subunit epsilon
MIRLEIITPDQTVFDGTVDAVTLPSADGEITVLENHIPLITTLMPGPVLVRQGETEQVYAVARGMIEVDGKTVRILSDIADRADDLEEEAAERARQEAERVMADKRNDAAAFAEASAIMDRELARVRTVRRRHSRRSFNPPPQ